MTVYTICTCMYEYTNARQKGGRKKTGEREETGTVMQKPSNHQ